jgi:hypothetical protein
VAQVAWKACFIRVAEEDEDEENGQAKVGGARASGKVCVKRRSWARASMFNKSIPSSNSLGVV